MFLFRPILEVSDFVSHEINAKLLAMNMIHYIGDQVSESGKPIDQLSDLCGMIDAPSEEIAQSILDELREKGVIITRSVTPTMDGNIYMGVNLSLEGWEQYEEEKRGGFDGGFGFIAMKFGDDRLDTFVQDVVKPCLRRHLEIDLVDLRDVAQAGVIDDIMRTKIRDAKFILADLTHDNSGAYWEAGYAEGLGKPVIYICEKAKFEEESTHFDVNHCTTIPWSKDNPDEFCDKLIAVLRRSLQI